MKYVFLAIVLASCSKAAAPQADLDTDAAVKTSTEIAVDVAEEVTAAADVTVVDATATAD